MDEKDFRNFMKGLSESTANLYVTAVREFDGWLFKRGKRLGDAKPSDIRQWANSLSKGKLNYFSGLKQFYNYKSSEHSNEMIETIEIIQREFGAPPPKHHLLLWEDFRARIEKAEKKVPVAKKRARFHYRSYCRTQKITTAIIRTNGT